MYDFKQHLLECEEILYEGIPYPNKGRKNLVGLLFSLIFMVTAKLLLNYYNMLDILSIAIILFIDAVIINSIVYVLFFKKYTVKDDCYCLTNKRALKYEKRKDKLTCGYLVNYGKIYTIHKRDNYGDVYMEIVYRETGDRVIDALELKDLITSSNSRNMPFMKFECIEDPDKVVSIAIEAKKALNEELEKLENK